jgi:fibronectin-binding autotransporter adhesin
MLRVGELGMMKSYVSLVTASLLFVFAPATQAQLFWDVNGANPGSSDTGDATGTWDSLTSNWTTDSSGSIGTTSWDSINTPVAEFSAGLGGSSSNYTVHVADAESTNGLTFDDVLVTIDSTGGTLTLNGATPTISIPTTGNLATISAPIAGTSGLSLNGGTLSTLVLSGANTYSGATNVGVATVLQLGAANAVPSGSVLTLAHSSSQTQFNMNGFDDTVRSITSTGTGSAPTIAIGSNTLMINDQAGDNFTYFGLYTTSAGGKIVKNGDGQLTLNNFPTGFTNGEFVVNSGTLGIAQNNALGTNANNSTLTINAVNSPTGPTLKRMSASSLNPSVANISIDGNFTYDSNGASDTQFNGNAGVSTTTLRADNPTITVIGDTIVDGSKLTGTFIFAGDIVDDGNIRGFTKSGPGTLTLGSKGNSYRGETTIQQDECQ